MRRTLSSPLTFFSKFVFPALIVGGLAYFLALAWMGKFTTHGGKPLSNVQLSVYTLMWTVLAAGIIASARSRKRVAVDEEYLYVSDYFSEICIPLSEVARVHEAGGQKQMTSIVIELRNASAFGKSIQFQPSLRFYVKGEHPVVKELQALCRQAKDKIGGDLASPFDPAETVFEAPDGSVVQVARDCVVYGIEGKEAACQEDKVFLKDVERITVTRNRKSGRISAIGCKVKGKVGTLEIGGFKPGEMEEIARLLESRAKDSCIELVEKPSAGSSGVLVLLAGIAALGATIGAGWLLHYIWTLGDQIHEAIGFALVGVVCLGALGVTAALWVGFWRLLRA